MKRNVKFNVVMREAEDMDHDIFMSNTTTVERVFPGTKVGRRAAEEWAGKMRRKDLYNTYWVYTVRGSMFTLVL